MILHYFRMALRHLNKVKWQALVSVLGMGAGLILFAVCNSFLRSELAANKNFATYDRLVAPAFLRENVSSASSLFKDDGICYKIDAMPQVDAIALIRGTEDCMLSINGEVEINARFACVDGEFGKVFQMPLVEGALQPFDNDPKSVIISREFAERLYGKYEGIVGEELNMVRIAGTDIGERLRIVAVVHDYTKSADNIMGDFDIIINAKSGSAAHLTAQNPYFRLYCTLHSISDIEVLNNISEKEEWAKLYSSRPLNGDNSDIIHFYHISQFSKTSVTVFRIVSMAGLTILLLSLIYTLNLFIGLFMLRSKELGLRKFLGAGILSNSLLLFAELILLTLCSLILSIVFCEIIYKVIGVDYLVLSKTEIIKHIIQYSGVLFILFAAICVVSVLMMNRVRNSKHRVKNITLGVQFFITLLFLAVSLVFHSMREERISAVAPCITEAQMKRILVMRAPAPYEKFSMFKSDIESMPQYSVAWRDTRYSMFEDRLLSKYLVNVDYLKMLNLPGAENLNEGDKFCYITKYMESAVDENGNIMLDNEVFKVTHVIDSRTTESVVYLPSDGWNPNRCELFIKINDEFSFDEEYDRLTNRMSKYYVVSSRLCRSLYSDTVGGDVAIFVTIAFCAMIISLLITVSGIVGTITLDTDRRKKEVAIRKINGAGFKQIYWLFAKLYFRIYVIVALLVTLILFYVNNMQLLGQFFTVSLLEWIAVYLFAALVIFLSICSKIYQVSRINPSEMLRAE